MFSHDGLIITHPTRLTSSWRKNQNTQSSVHPRPTRTSTDSEVTSHSWTSSACLWPSSRGGRIGTKGPKRRGLYFRTSLKVGRGSPTVVSTWCVSTLVKFRLVDEVFHREVALRKSLTDLSETMKYLPENRSKSRDLLYDRDRLECNLWKVSTTKTQVTKSLTQVIKKGSEGEGERKIQ